MKKIKWPLLIGSFILIVVILIVLFISKGSLSIQWKQADGPYGGYIHCFTMEGDNIFAGTEGNGVFLSSNAGEAG